MSNSIVKFSDAAKLYARHKGVVDEMYKAFTADIDSFLEALLNRIRERVKTGSLEEEGKGFRSWYIYDETLYAGYGEEEGRDCVYATFRPDDAQIISPGVLTLTVAADGELRPYREKLKSLLAGLQPGDNAKITKNTSGSSLLTVAISYGDEDPVEDAVEPILTLLTALNAAEKQLRAAVGKIRSSKTSE